MTDTDMKRLLDFVPFEPIAVTVKANDYAYDGWIIMGGAKRGGAFRVAVEDEYGRIFIHNCAQVRTR